MFTNKSSTFSENIKKKKHFETLTITNLNNREYQQSTILYSHVGGTMKFTEYSTVKASSRLGILMGILINDKSVMVKMGENKVVRGKRVIQNKNVIDLARKLSNDRIEFFKRALKHDNIHEVVLETENTVTVRFLPISTSPRTLKCGNEKFVKIEVHTYTEAGVKTTFYITRVIFEYTIRKENYIEWKESTIIRLPEQIKEKIFNYSQVDMSEHPYSILRDTQLTPETVFASNKEGILDVVNSKFTPLED